RDYKVTEVQTCALPIFENQLCANINAAVQDCGAERVKRISGRLLLPLKPDADLPEIKTRLRRTFGIAYFGEAWASPQAVENLKEIGRASCRERVEMWVV